MPPKKSIKKKIPKKSSKKSKKTIPKRNIIKKSGKKVIPKKITKRIPKKDSVSNSEIEMADPPANIKIKSWQKGLGEEKKLLQAKVLRPKSELWDKRKIIQKTDKKKSGVVVFVDGLEKSGKTNFEITVTRFKGFKGRRRMIPAGSPLYLLDTEFSAEDEADYNFCEEVDNGDIIIQNVFVEDRLTKIINPSQSADMLEEWAYSLKDELVGTIGIDTFTDYCNWLKWDLEEKKGGHTADGKPKSKLSRFDFGELYKRVNTFLRNLKRMRLNVILIAKVKEDWISGADQYSGYWNGKYKSDATKGFGYWVDIIARYEKIKHDDGSVTRTLKVIDSRFETVDMKGRKYELTGDPTFEGLINLFKDLI